MLSENFIEQIEKEYREKHLIGYDSNSQIELHKNESDLIDKQTAVNFAQHLLKDFSTQEVTLEDLNKFLEK